MTAWPATTEYAGSSAHLTELLAAIAAGQQDALAQLYHLTRTAVYGLSLSYLKNTHDAQDITQDVFVHVWDHAPQYRPTGPLPWLAADGLPESVPDAPAAHGAPRRSQRGRMGRHSPAGDLV